MIIDAHAHCFPFVGNVGGFSSAEEHVRYWQEQISTHRQGARRVRDGVLETKPTLWNGKTTGQAGLRKDVNFHVAHFGRFEWEADGEKYFHQYFPPTLDDMTATPERMIAQMQYVGVDKALIHYGRNYGVTDEYLSDVLARFSDKFRCCTGIDENRANEDEEREKLERAITKLGLSALYFSNNGFSDSNFQNHFDDSKYLPFWEQVARLGIPVLWDIRFMQRSTHADYMEEARRLHRHVRRFPQSHNVLTHSVPRHALDSDGRIPDDLWALFAEPNLTVELLFPILEGHRWEYPYSEAQPIIRQLYDRLGPGKLIWGSDMPNVERNCTYRQSLDYLRRYNDYIPAAEMNMILGSNAEKIYFSQPFTVPTAKQPAMSLRERGRGA
jgi:predicted TIM-barrel fold metal-dependent hydrolase